MSWPLNELVKLTMLWTTRPRTAMVTMTDYFSPGVFTASFTLMAIYGSNISSLLSIVAPLSTCISFTRIKPTPGIFVGSPSVAVGDYNLPTNTLEILKHIIIRNIEKSFWCWFVKRNWRVRDFFFILTLKVPNKNCSRWHFIFLLLCLEENKAWSFMWILCLAEDSLETTSLILSDSLETLSYFLRKTMKKYLWMSSAAVVIGALRVNSKGQTRCQVLQQLILSAESAADHGSVK